MQWNRGPGNRFAWMFNCGGRLRFWFFVCTRNRIHARDVTRVIGPLTRLRVHYLLDWTSQNRVCCWPPLFCCFFFVCFFFAHHMRNSRTYKDKAGIQFWPTSFLAWMIVLPPPFQPPTLFLKDAAMIKRSSSWAELTKRMLLFIASSN